MKIKGILFFFLAAIILSSCTSTRHSIVPRYKESSEERKTSETREKSSNVRSAPEDRP